ncbi:MAG: hypothetical protein V4568_06430 [Pseudomonadota bacterium]
MTDAEILKRARDLCEKNGRALWFVLGWRTVVLLVCGVCFIGSMLAKYVRFTGTPMVELVPDIALAIAVPPLFVGPVIWLIYRCVRNPYENN